ncbi:DDE-type integrase/transposase/recombinase [Phormidium tenue FACHB-886]|nr:DDE-type integrase/transposase/recombinase [Phormidium tenue FACHB-886]
MLRTNDTDCFAVAGGSAGGPYAAACAPSTNIKIKGVWKYLYRAVDSEGNTLDLRHERKAGWQGSSKMLS